MSKSRYNDGINPQKEHRPKMTNTLANEEIRASQVRLIDFNSQNLGIFPTRDALNKARNAGFDLIVINETAVPVVAKMLDLKKYLYEAKLAEKERARKSRENTVHVKQINLRPVTDQHDISVKAKKAVAFLEDGCKVQISIKFRGRELSFTQRGFEVISKFLDLVGNYKLEKEPVLSGNAIMALLVQSKSQEDDAAQ